jgi:hypothetical protein
MESLGKGEILLLAVLAVNLSLIGVGAVSIWNASGVQIGQLGWIVLGVGALFSLLIACGLMLPIFFSSRGGDDDRGGSL